MEVRVLSGAPTESEYDMKSNFDIIKVTGNTVFLIDNALVMHTMSVTNDAEAVVKYINEKCPRKRVVYKDTEGHWDELIHENGEFKEFRPYHEYTP